MSTPIPLLGNKTPEQLKVAELREELKKRGFNGKGLKKDLVERLDEILRQEAAQATSLFKATGEDYNGGAETKTVAASSVVKFVAGLRRAEATSAAVEPQTAVPVLQTRPIEVDDVSLDEFHSGPVDSQLRISLPVLGNDFSADVQNHVLQEVDSVPDLFSDAVAIGAVPGAIAEGVPQENIRTSGEKFINSALVSPVSPEEEPDEVDVIESGQIGDEKSSAGKTVDADGKVKFQDAMDSKAHDSMLRRERVLKEEVYNGVVEAGSQIKSGQIKDGKPVVGNMFKVEDRARSEHAMKAKPPEGGSCEVEFDVHCVQLRPFRSPGDLGTTASTDDVTRQTLTPEISMENPRKTYTEATQERAFGKGHMEEINPSDVETIAERAEGISPQADSVVAVTTAFLPETVLMETKINISMPEAGREEGSLTGGADTKKGRILAPEANARTPSIDGKEKGGFVEAQDRGTDDVVDVEPYAKLNDLKLVETDLDSSTGVKRRDVDESSHLEPTKRQRRWNSEKCAGASADVKTCPKAASTGVLKETTAPEVGNNTQAPVTQSPPTTASSTAKASASISLEKPSSSKPAIPRTEMTTNGESDMKRTVPPPSRPPTLSLKIDRFVRPFTIKAVRKLLEQTGTVKEMWMDQIKTHCFVTYSSVEEAVSTRNALYNLQWPLAGGKLLVAEFVEPEEVKVRLGGLTEKPVVTPVVTPRASASNNAQAAGTTGVTPLVPKSAFPHAPPLSLPPKARPALLSKKDFESPIPTLDDLFKKTRVKPQIYFLPLNDEQVAAKSGTKQPMGKPPLKA